VIFWRKLPLRLASDSILFLSLLSFFPFPTPNPQSSQKREWVIPRFPFPQDLREWPSLLSQTHFSSFHEHDFKFCFTWYPTDTTLCLWSGFISPRIRTFLGKHFHGLFSKKKTLKSGVVPSFLSWSWSQLPPRRKNFPDEIIWLSWKTKQNLEIWPFLNSRSEMWVWESGRKIDPATGVTPVAGPILLQLNVSDSPNFFSEFFFPNSVLLSSFFWAVEWIHESPPSVFSSHDRKSPQRGLGRSLKQWRYQCNFPAPSWAPT